MVGSGLHVLAGEGVHHPRHRRLSRARLRPHRLLRGRHRRPAVLDRSAHRISRPDTHAAPAIQDSDAADAADGRAAGATVATVPKPKLMRRLRRTKIVATLGPASSERSVIARLFEAGADV